MAYVGSAKLREKKGGPQISRIKLPSAAGINGELMVPARRSRLCI